MALELITQPITYISIITSLASLCSFCLAVLWISTLPFLLQAIIGAGVGLAAMASLFFMQTHRSQHRKRRAVNLAQLASADILALRGLLPHKHSVSWLPDILDFEKVRWINAELDEVWPFFKEAVSGLLNLQLQTVLDQYKFGVIQELSIKTINLGRKSPVIHGIKVSETGKDETTFEVKVDWRQNQDQEMVLHVQTSGPDYTVQVKDFVIYAVLKLTFKPFKEEFPGFAALVFSILEPPLVDFQTKVLSGDVKKLPGMQKAVDNVLLTALMDLLVWPSRVVIPFIPGDYSYLAVSCMGYLYVELLEAKELANKEITGKSDPYVVLFVRRRQDSIKESSRMHETSSPVWNEKFIFNIEDPEVQKLTVKVMDTATLSLADSIGSAELPINQLEANIQKDIWVNLAGDPKKLGGNIAGRVHLLVEFKPIVSSCREMQDVKETVVGCNQEKDLLTESVMNADNNNETQVPGESGVRSHDLDHNSSAAAENRNSEESTKSVLDTDLTSERQTSEQLVMDEVENHSAAAENINCEEPTISVLDTDVASDGQTFEQSVMDQNYTFQINSSAMKDQRSENQVGSCEGHHNQTGDEMSVSHHGRGTMEATAEQSDPSLGEEYKCSEGNHAQIGGGMSESQHRRDTIEVIAEKSEPSLTEDDKFASEIYKVD